MTAGGSGESGRPVLGMSDWDLSEDEEFDFDE